MEFSEIQLISILKMIEKDLHVIANNSEALKMKYVGYIDDPGPKGVEGNPNTLKK